MMQSRWTVYRTMVIILSLPFLLAACDDNSFAPENVGSFAVDVVVVSGTPDQGGFVASFESLSDTADSGSLPIGVDDPPVKFTQVPLGPARVQLSEDDPDSCTIKDPVKTVTVVNDETKVVTFTISCE